MFAPLWGFLVGGRGLAVVSYQPFMTGRNPGTLDGSVTQVIPLFHYSISVFALWNTSNNTPAVSFQHRSQCGMHGSIFKSEITMQTTPLPGVDPAPQAAGDLSKATHLSMGVDALCDAASAAAGRTISPSLYNIDLAPTKREGRRWTSYSIFTLWANDVHSLGNYAFAIGLFALGLGGWQILLALGVGAVLLFALLSLSGFMGDKTGVPFPVMSRISFGIRGAQIASLLRGAVAIAWFGIQTYLASVVLRVLLIAMAPALRDLDTPTPSSASPRWAGHRSCSSGSSSWSSSVTAWK